MGLRDDLIARYGAELRDRCGIAPDMALLARVAAGCGPAIFDADGGLIDMQDPAERRRIRRNFLVRRLGLADTPALDEAIEATADLYENGSPLKYRAVLHYMLVLHFGRADHYR